jgi:hypothetical protein
MPYKFNQHCRHHFEKQSYIRKDWGRYNRSLRRRGDITIWLSQDVIEQWYEQERVYDGTGTPNLYSDMAIMTAHEIRQVFKLPLRQCEGFVNSLFKMTNIELKCPSYSVLSKRLKKLNLNRPFYRKAHRYGNNIKAIAIDSSGLKCYGEDEWHTEKYGLKCKKDWRKIHLVVDNHQIIQCSELSDKDTQDMSMVDVLIEPIQENIRHISADAAYDNSPTYQKLSQKFPNADIVISPQKDAIYDKKNHFYRNRNVLEIQCLGRMGWQKRRNYGRRNYSELAIQRYKRILGNKLHARDFERQKNETIIGCSILNKMTCITLGEIYPVN